MRFQSVAALLMLLAAVLGCGRFQSGTANSNSAVNSANSSAPSAVTKVADVTSLVGKSKDEVKRLVTGGRVTYDPSDAISYEFPQGELSFNWNDAIDNPITFTLPMASAGGESYSLGDTAERLGEYIGVDLKGKTPTKKYDFMTEYDGGTMNGKKVTITLTPTESGKDLYREIKVTTPKQPRK